MGEEIQVGGRKETEILADKLAIDHTVRVLDVCSALGGPARFLAQQYGCEVVGLDATKHMVEEAIKRTAGAGLSHLVSYHLGNALDMPFKAKSFDVIWGQDAWCYVTDKDRLLHEAYRVLRPGGRIGFTDWIQTGSMPDQEWEALNSFMAFPYMETLEGYIQALKNSGFREVKFEDLSRDFARHCHMYQDTLRTELKEKITKAYDAELYMAADEGLNNWVLAADASKVGRGRLTAEKPLTP